MVDDGSTGSQSASIPSYIQELMAIVQASQARMQSLEETITRLAATSSTPPNPSLNGNQNTSDGTTPPNMNASNGNNTSGNPLTSDNTNTTNPITGNVDTSTGGAGTSAAGALETTSQGYVTKEELQWLLEEKNKSLSFSEFDLKLPYPARVAAKPYPKDYTSPKFKQFNGKTGDAREHVMKFVETLGVAGLDDDLKLKEFSKSLTEKAYTWYVNLTPGSVDSWNQMCRMFGEKFFSTQEKVTLIDLGREYQKSREDLLEYIQRFRERVLDIQDSHDEKELVKVCIQGMFDEYRVHLENLPLPTFATLVEAARRTNNTVQRQRGNGRFARRNNPTVNAIQGGGRGRRDQHRSNLRPRRDDHRRDENNDDDPPPFPVPVDRVKALLQDWIRDENISLPYTPRLPTEEEKSNPNYCDYHRRIGHHISKCRNLRKIFHQRVHAREVVIRNNGVQNNPLPAHQNLRGHVNMIIHAHNDDPSPSIVQPEKAHAGSMVTSSVASSLMKTPSFRHFFDQLGFTEESRKEAALALVQIAGEQYGECNMVGKHMGKIASGYENAIVFTEADMCTSHPYHNKPLYVESTINGFSIRRTFIDDGSSVNLMPLSTLKAVNIDVKSLRRPMTISSFDNKEIVTLGQVTVNFKMGPIQDQTCFHVIDADVAYHLLIGRKFLHTHNIIPSSRHQCIKGYWKGKEIFIPATKAPFERNEVNYTEASFFEDPAEDGETIIGRPIGVPLAKWEETYEKKDMNSEKKTHYRGRKRNRGNASRNDVVNNGGQNSGVSSYTREDGKTIYYL